RADRSADSLQREDHQRVGVDVRVCHRDRSDAIDGHGAGFRGHQRRYGARGVCATCGPAVAMPTISEPLSVATLTAPGTAGVAMCYSVISRDRRPATLH